MNKWDNKTAEWYAQKYGDYPTNYLAVDMLDLHFDSVVVDVGCGTGSALRHAAIKVTEGSLIGIDPVPRMLEIAREQTENHPAFALITFLEGSAASLPVENAIADFVFAFDSFDHWGDKKRGLSEVHRILRPKGSFVVVKDGGIPGGKNAKKAFSSALEEAGFIIAQESQVTENQVSFTLWKSSLKDYESA